MNAPLWQRHFSAGRRESVTDIYLIIMLFIFPLFTGFSGYHNFTVSKYIFFLAATLLWLLALAAVFVKEREFCLPLSPARAAVLVLMAVCCVSSLCSKYFISTLIGTGRYDGLVTLLLYGAIFLGVSTYTRPKEMHFLAFAAAVTVCCLICVFQMLDINIFFLYPNNYSYYDAGVMYSGTILGTMGNLNILASWLSLAAPLFFGLFVCGERSRDALYLVPMFFSVLVLFAAASDSGILALGACALVGAPVVLTSLRRVRRALAALAAAAAAVGLALAFEPSYLDRVFSFGADFGPLPLAAFAAGGVCLILSAFLGLVKREFSPRLYHRFFTVLVILSLLTALLFVWFYPSKSGPVYELRQLLHGNWDDSFGSSRLLIWRYCLELIPERPLLGGGPGTLALWLDIDFSRYVEETGKTLSTYVDNAHNEYLSYLVNTGVLSLLAYLATLALGFALWLKQSAKRNTAAMGLGLCACCVQGFFGLGSAISAPVFWIILALLLSEQPAIHISPGGQK